jgi:hypothetical protein
MQRSIGRVASLRHGEKVVATPTLSAKGDVRILLIVHASMKDTGNQRAQTGSESR